MASLATDGAIELLIEKNRNTAQIKRVFDAGKRYRYSTFEQRDLYQSLFESARAFFDRQY